MIRQDFYPFYTLQSLNKFWLNDADIHLCRFVPVQGHDESIIVFSFG